MEELNKNQIVLLTLLVSFVTSIATGIVTVTLLEQAPPAVTQTINRVVERTIEKTVPGETKTTTVIKEVPIIVTEEQLIVDVINAAGPALVRIADRAGTMLGSGFVIGDDGLIATAEKILPVTRATNDSYTIAFSDGRTGVAKLVKLVQTRGVTLLRLDLSKLKDETGAPITTPSLTKLELTGTAALPGQTVVAIGVSPNNQLTVAGGLVSGLFTQSESGNAFINTSAANQSNLGGPLLNTKGKVVGLVVDTGTALTAAMIAEALK